MPVVVLFNTVPLPARMTLPTEPLCISKVPVLAKVPFPVMAPPLTVTVPTVSVKLPRLSVPVPLTVTVELDQWHR